MTEFGILNWTILISYILGNLLLGFIISKKVSTADDFYLGQKQTPWWAIGISVIATYVSALTFLGAPAWAYKDGLSVIAIHLNYPLVIIIVITFFFPFFYNAGVASIYEYQELELSKKPIDLSGHQLAIYSLTEGAGRRAKSVISNKYPGLGIILNHDCNLSSILF